MGLLDRFKEKPQGVYQMQISDLQARWQAYQARMILIERAKDDLASASASGRPPLEIYNISNRVSGEMYDLLWELMDTYPALMTVALQGEEAVVQIEQMQAVKFKLERKPKAAPPVAVMKSESKEGGEGITTQLVANSAPSSGNSKEPQNIEEWKAAHPDAKPWKIAAASRKFRKMEKKMKK